MKFTHNAYRSLLSLLRAHGYECATYHDWPEYSRCVILRHDIDDDISRAVKFAELEADAHWGGTYFVLLRNDAYNAFSTKNADMLKRIMGCGHEIGLHFDETGYPEDAGDADKIRRRILDEADILGRMVGVPITCVSMHRPSKAILDADLQIPGMVNSYGQTFFRDFKYLSDSRRHWREPVEEIIRSEAYERLHILTHAFWYREDDRDMHTVLETFINHASYEQYRILRENITNLDEVISECDVKGYMQEQ